MKGRYNMKQKKAFYMGVGAASVGAKVSSIKKAVSKLTLEEKQSFYNGYDKYMLTKKI